ncbi:unnamed protein product [Brugia timori]|uniref:Uncharacterized protein n=1 Tax=Brugia timori TaxID=42155 RepID=A0A3P7T761_9BILA|nr:unnamed protein product [Brugia timori]
MSWFINFSFSDFNFSKFSFKITTSSRSAKSSAISVFNFFTSSSLFKCPSEFIN